MKTGLISGGIALIATLGISALALAGPAADHDGDNMFDVLDNCSTVFQDTSQGQDCDTDQDGYGNYCDGDFDNDWLTIPFDFAIFNTDLTATGVDTNNVGSDMDCDGYVIPFDFGLFNAQLTSTGIPGPSGLSCQGQVPCAL